MSKGTIESSELFVKPERQYAGQLLPTPQAEAGYYEPFDEGEIDLREYLVRVARHKWIVVIVTAVLTAGAGLYLYSQPSVYQAESRVQVDSENEVGLDAKSSASPFEDRAYFNTQLELLESPELIRNVIKKLDLDKNPAFLGGYPEQQSSTSYDPGQTAAPQGDREAERLNPIVKNIVGSLKIEPVLQTRQTVKDTRLISIRFRHENPQFTSLLANAVADQLVTSNLSKKLQANTNESEYLKNNIAELKEQIRRDEERLLGYGRNYQLPSFDEKDNIVVERLSGLNRQLLEAENERKLAEAAYKASLAPGAANALSEKDARQISDIDAKIDDLRQKRAQLLVEVTEKYPEVQEIDKQIAVLEKSAEDKRERASSLLKTSLEVRYRGAVSREQSIRKSFDEQWGQSLTQNNAAIGYRIIQRGLETNRKLLDEMQQRDKENEMLKAKSPNNIHVANYAVTPTEPLDQKRSQYLGLAFLFSFAIGIGAALVRDYFDDAVHTTTEVERTLSLPAIAAIPKVSPGFFGYLGRGKSTSVLQLGDGKGERSLVRARGELLIGDDADSPLAEAFRRLRTVLTLSPELGPVKKLLVTSSRQAEGKTTTAMNIAVSLSQTGLAVLAIDADLRSPRLHKIFGVPNDEGLADILVRDTSQDQAYGLIQRLSENLYLLPSGKQLYESTECLSSNRMRDLLASLETIFDFIVIDSPPVKAFADSSILGAMTDGVLLVVQEDRNSVETLRETRKILSLVGANIIGVVLNKVRSVNGDYAYRYHDR